LSLVGAIGYDLSMLVRSLLRIQTILKIEKIKVNILL